jgi:hypothetical protein
MNGLGRRLGLAGLALGALGCVGGSDPSGSGDVATATPDARSIEAQLHYSCGQLAFSAELILAPARQDETADNPISAELRRHLASAESDFQPDAGWTFVGETGGRAQFIVRIPDETLQSVELERQSGAWKVVGWGGCPAHVVAGLGLGAAEWRLPDGVVPDPGLQTFDALVTELACNSGQPADGRIMPPQILTDVERVIVIFTVRPRPGGHECPSNPSTQVRVELPAPLGNRQLLDGGSFPFRDPAEARF